MQIKLFLIAFFINLVNLLFSFENETKVIGVIDYEINNSYHSAIFLDNNGDNKYDYVLHIANTGSQLSYSYMLRHLIKEGDIIKYEYGEYVKPQWYVYANYLYDKYGISSNLIIDMKQILELNGKSILLSFDFEDNKWKESMFPYAYKNILKIDRISLYIKE